ncbi:hypothetical protein Cgig2_008904 [Carnegiea gigantea]|uniref:Reverse transcriptase zinc-binding domain-containing protein n=1 Tax=Carnegiea gigantea TaxID=171969 RepID=A0A9Q1KKD1_9CARY|nr:hypothetical protein Cgig2_008904 [Carnegiea gigantea]
MVWNRSIIPRHAFITWIYSHKRLPAKVRRSKYRHQDTVCSLCHSEGEDDQHILFTCPYAQEVWRGLKDWWNLPILQINHSFFESMINIKGPKAKKSMTYAIHTARIYYLWRARNMAVFQNKRTPSHQTIMAIKEQVRNRILFLNQGMHKFQSYADNLLL